MARIKSILNGRYMVTSDGRIWSNISKKYLATSIINSGYSHICLRDSVNGKVKGYTVHSLVAEAFLPKPADADVVDYEIDHINSNKQDNDVSNLQWVTHWENMHKPDALEKIKKAITSDKCREAREKKLAERPRKIHEKECKVYIIRETNKEYTKLQDLAADLNISSARICQVLNGNGEIHGVHITRTTRVILY